MTGYCRSDIAHVPTTIVETVNLQWALSSSECGLKQVSPVQQSSAMRSIIESQSAGDGGLGELELQMPHRN